MIGTKDEKVSANSIVKEKFEAPQIDVVRFETADIITTSGDGLNQYENGYGDDLEW